MTYDPIATDYIHELERHAVREHIRTIREGFAEQIIEDASSPFFYETLGETEFVEILQELESRGYRVTDDDGETHVQMFGDPNVVYDLLHEVDSERQFVTKPDEKSVHGVDIQASPELPKQHAVFVHDNAIAPNTIGSMERPWLVKHPKGVVPVQVGYIEDD